MYKRAPSKVTCRLGEQRTKIGFSNGNRRVGEGVGDVGGEVKQLERVCMGKGKILEDFGGSGLHSATTHLLLEDEDRGQRCGVDQE
jgi:hypothetical protein